MLILGLGSPGSSLRFIDLDGIEMLGGRYIREHNKRTWFLLLRYLRKIFLFLEWKSLDVIHAKLLCNLNSSPFSYQGPAKLVTPVDSSQ